MINRAVLDQVEEAIDSFEEDWSPESRAKIYALLETYDLTDDYAALTELLRIDIELRYERGLAIQIDDYFTEFGELLEIPGCAAQIAFEDFRSRSARGHALAIDRWEHVPGIKNEIWFQQLASKRSASRSRSRIEKRAPDSDPAFEAALEASGFQLVHEIGQGALSHVYLATQHELADRYVVLKVVNRTLAEPQSMAMLQHTNIVPIYSFHRILSRSVICMPYAGSVTLEHFLKDKSNNHARGGESLVVTVQKRVSGSTIFGKDDELVPGSKSDALIPAADESAVLKPLEQLRSLGCNELAIWIFHRLASALAHSHARGVLHGDLKPGNVLIRNDGEPALLDFNLSQSLDRPAPQLVGGTLPYMSPESYRMLMGQSIAPHSASDIYSLGVMLFEFVTGRLPYALPKSIAPIDLQPAINARKGEPGWRDDDVVSPGLHSIINRCLDFSPEHRYATAEDLQQDLECERQDLPLANAIEPRRARLKKWTRRHPRAILGTLAATLLLLLIPIGFSAAAWRNQSLHMTALANFEAFAQESAGILSAIMADPKRHAESGVLDALRPLEDFGLLDGSGLARLESSDLTPEQREFQRDTLIRHIAQVAFAETDRLRPNRAAGPLDDQQLQRLDLLISAADRIRDESESRACLFLSAERARLAGDATRYEALRRRAEGMDVSSDSEAYLEAVRMMASRQWDAARDLLTTLADGNNIPSNLRWTMLGRSQYNAIQYEDAKISITQSIEHAPHASRLWFMRGLCYYKLHQYGRAESDFTRTLNLEPSFVAALLHRGLCRLALRRPDEGIADYDRGLELSRSHVELLLLRSRAYRRAGRTLEADHDFAEALAADGLTASALLSRAKARINAKDFEGALEDLQEADSIDPDARAVLGQMARLLSRKLVRPQQAISVFNQLLAISPDDESALIDRAVLLARTGSPEAAAIDMDKALRHPNAAATLYQAACVNALLLNKQRALTLLAQSIQTGHEPGKLSTDPDLASIRDMDGFRAIAISYQIGRRGQPSNHTTDGDRQSLSHL